MDGAMSVIINGTTGISGVDGSASTPAVQGADTNTGVFFPAADTIAFAEGGTEVMRINSSGNLGIGTTSPAAPLTIVRDHVSSNGTLKIQTVTSFASGGLSSIDLSDSDGTRKGLVYQDSTGFAIETASSLPITFRAGGGERARITSGGTVFINNSSAINSEILNIRQASSSNLTGIVVGYGGSGGQWRSMSVTSSNILTFNNGLNEGTLSSAGAWTNASDARLKTNIRDIEYGLNTVITAKPRHFERVDVEGTYIGFVAQELQNVIPEVVSGDPETQFGVDYGSLVAVAFKAIQELNAKVETLEAQNAAFEARLAALEAK
jgi:hypothetical protein